MKYGLRPEVICRINGIVARFSQVRSAILYGSRAKDTFHNGSDIDLAVTGKDLTLHDLLRIRIEREELNLPYEVDLCILEKITNQDRSEHIHRVGIPIYERASH